MTHFTHLIQDMRIQISIYDNFFESINSGQTYLGSPRAAEQLFCTAHARHCRRSVLWPQKPFWRGQHWNPPASLPGDEENFHWDAA